MTPELNRKLQIALEILFQNCFVVDQFTYKASVMDYAVIVNDTLIEVEHKTNKVDYQNDFRKLVRAGRIVYNKHAAIKAGKFISNAFYFICPTRVLSANDVPDYCGLITYNLDGNGNPILTFRKEANYIHSTYLKASFYKTLSKQLNDKNRRLREISEIKANCQADDLAADARKSNPKRRGAIQDTPGPIKAAGKKTKG